MRQRLCGLTSEGIELLMHVCLLEQGLTKISGRVTMKSEVEGSLCFLSDANEKKKCFALRLRESFGLAMARPANFGSSKNNTINTINNSQKQLEIANKNILCRALWHVQSFLSLNSYFVMIYNEKQSPSRFILLASSSMHIAQARRT